MGTKRRLGDVVGTHADLMIARAKIKLGEELDVVKLIKQFVNHGDGEGVLDGDGVQDTVVNVEMP